MDVATSTTTFDVVFSRLLSLLGVTYSIGCRLIMSARYVPNALAFARTYTSLIVGGIYIKFKFNASVTTATDTLGSSWASFSERPSDDGGTDTGAGATDAQPSPTTGHTNASNDSANQGGGNGRLSPNATRAAHDDAEREAEIKQRRIAATPEGHLSPRMCPRYGATMGATSVSRDEIAKTTRRRASATTPMSL